MKKLNRSSRKVVSSAVAPIHRTRRARLRSVLPEMLEERQLMSTYTVTTSADSGAGSLRQAILNANADSSADTINFEMTDGSTISLLSSLPAITNTVTIDAQGQTVDLSGAAAGAAVNGLDFEAGSGNSLVSGLTINSFNGAGVVLNSGGVTLQSDFIGTDSTGSVAMGNHDGVLITSNANHLIDNVISGNHYSGVSVTGDGNVLQGNFIGTDATGTEAVSNSADGGSVTAAGVYVSNATNTLIGGPAASDRNVISGNVESGITFANDTGAGNLVEGNYIGVVATGSAALGNDYAGIDLGTLQGLAVSNVSIVGNVISANLFSGIRLHSATYVTIQGNLIGTDASGHESIDPTTLNPAFGNAADGITIDAGSAYNVIGGTTQAQRNVIAGNGVNGISVLGAGAAANLVEGNYIGVDATGMIAAGNASQGVYVQAGQLTLGADGAGNVISGNYGYGVQLNGGTSQLFGNLIGVAADGVTPMGNAQDGVYIANSSGNVIGSTTPGWGNVIAYNGVGSIGDGVNVLSGISNAIEGNSIHDNTTLGIDLGSDGVTLNDAEGHTGPNNFQDFPVVGPVSGDGTNATLNGTMTGVAGDVYTIDFYANAVADPSGHGQGQQYVGSIQVSFSTSGTQSFSATFAQPVAGGAMLLQWTATATDQAGNTSEFALDAKEATLLSSSTALTSSMNPSTFGQPVTFTAQVTGSGAEPTGTVQFLIDGVAAGAPVALDANGDATFTTSSLSVAGHTVAAVYGGDATYAGSSKSLVQNVGQAQSTTTLSASSPSSTAGQPVTLTATVGPSINGTLPTGTVTFYDNGQVLGGPVTLVNGVATLTPSSLPIGTDALSAQYSGDTNFLASTGTASETVNAAPSSISGVVTNDLTGNGFSADDAPLAGWTVDLFMNDGTAPLQTAVTASDGSFSFNNLAPGSYTVQEVLPAGWTETGGGAGYTVTVISGNNFTGVNFDNFKNASIGGTVYRDLTGNGFSADDTPMSGVTVNLFANGAATPVATATSAADGTYSFTNLGPGSYTVQEIVPAGYQESGGAAGYTLAVSSGQAISGDNFDNYLTPTQPPPPPPPSGQISGYVFCDDNLNGVFDATSQDGIVSPESGEAGASVTLTFTNAAGQAVSYTATTDAHGYYSFGGLAAGTYTVSLAGYSPDHQAEQSHGSVKISNSTTVQLGAGQTLAGAAEGASTTNNGLDFAEIAPGGLQGFVWADTNNDGNVDFNEAGIVNVTIQLNGVTYSGAKVSQTTVTDNNGEYIFTNLQPGTYTLTEATPSGYTDGKDSVGSLGGSETYSSNCGSSYGCSTGQTNCGSNPSNCSSGQVNNCGGGNYSCGQSCYNDCYGSYGYNCFTGYSNNCYSNCYSNCGGSNNCGNCGGNSNNCNSQSNCGWSSGCNNAQNTFSSVQIGGCEDVGIGYNFGEKTPGLGNTNNGGCCGGSCQTTDTASLAFWHNSYGQALLCSLNGGPSSKALGNWLAAMFPKMYGSQAKVNFAGMTNVQIAAFYNANDFNVSGIKLDAAVLSAALSSYVTNSTWAGGNYAVKYGFTVSGQGVGYDTINVGSNGAAFGVANNSTVTILQALDATDQQSNDGLLYNGNTTMRAEAYNVYAAIAQNGLST